MHFPFFVVVAFLSPTIFTRVTDVRNYAEKTSSDNHSFNQRTVRLGVGLPVDLTMSESVFPLLNNQNLLAWMEKFDSKNFDCFWSGTAPFCNGYCGDSYRSMKQDKLGDGSRCWTGWKKYCCKLKNQHSTSQIKL